MRKWSKYVVGTALILCFSLILSYLFYFRGPKNLKLNIEFPNYGQGLLFHPDSVIEFSWTTHVPRYYKKKTIGAKRPDRLSPWTPKLDAMDAQPILNLLASLKYEEKKDLGNPLVSLFLKFDNNQSAEGIWNGKDYIWISGPNQNKGAELTGKQTLYFLSGKQFGKNKHLSWCPSRISNMTLSPSDSTVQASFRMQDGIWVDGKTGAKAEANRVELWMGQHCDLEILQYLDADLIQMFKSMNFKNKAQFEFENLTSATFQWNDIGIFEMLMNGKKTYFHYNGHWWP